MLDNTVFSIGYGNRKTDTFLELIHTYGITKLVDIRSNPFSRFQSAYNKARLQSLLYEHGVGYLFMGDALGGKPMNEMFYTNGKLNYELITRSREYQLAISDLIDEAGVGERICLMCCELDENTCHRKTLVAESLCKIGVVVNHITKLGDIQPHINCSPALHLF